MITVAVAAMAQDSDTEWYSNVPEGYLPVMTKEIISRESPCNQGEEAFMDFIPKFRKNATFRKSRIAIPAEDEMGASIAQAYESWGIVKAKRGIENGIRFFLVHGIMSGLTVYVSTMKNGLRILTLHGVEARPFSAFNALTENGI